MASFRSRSKATAAPKTGRGSALLIVMMIAALLLVSLTAAIPNLYQEARREREAELIFRGNQYARAVVLFRRQFHRFPSDVKELLQTNGMRFLRKAYPDPFDPKGKWRFIHSSAQGVLLDSKVMKQPLGLPGLPGATPATGQTSPATEAAPPQSQGTLGLSGSSSELSGGFIAGVACTRHQQAIRVLNKHQYYDEWEFLGIETGAAALPGAIPPQAPALQPPGGQTNPPATNPAAPSGAPAAPTQPENPPPASPDTSSPQL